MTKKLAVVCLLGLVFSAMAFSQVDRAAVTGRVGDPSGAIVPEAVITVTYATTGLARSVTSNGSGTFLIAGLPVGHVVIDVAKDGFRTLRTETDLSVGETKTLDMGLEVSSVDSSVQVVAEAELIKNTASYGATLGNGQLEQLPINGRNWQNLMTMIPGAIDTGAGNGASVRFFGHGGDDNNFHIDGVDATTVRNQADSKSRVMISKDAIAEFRVNSALYSAESGGGNGGQVDIVTKSGTNQLHGSLFEYLRNSAFDARSPFDGATLPAFRMNQFGATAGGTVVKDKTFFFLSYEGLIQRQGKTQTGFVPSDAFRAKASPALAAILAVYPKGQTATRTTDVLQWNGVGSSAQDEHAGTMRIDHRFTDRFTSYFRFSKNDTNAFSPNAALPVGTGNLDAPTSGLFDFLYLISPRTTNELRVGANYSEPLNSATTATGINIAVAVPSLSTIPADTKRLAIGISQSLIDQWTTFRGAHTIKAGVEVRRMQLLIHDWANAQAGTLTFASLADFQSNKLTTAEVSGELPTKQMRKMQYFGYVQDEWKMSPALTANIGLRYELFNVFSEIHHRDIPFDIQSCGGYCPAGSAFGFPDRNNFAPRVSLAWAPQKMHDRTVIRVGAGTYYGDAQMGDAYSPANNDTQRFTLSQATTPGLAYPIDNLLNPNVALATAPRSMPRDKRNQLSQQWGASIQQALGKSMSLQVGYNGQETYHVFTRTYVNVINPLTGKRQLPALDQIDVRGGDGVSSFEGLVSTFQINNWKGLLVRTNYMFSHALNDGSSGGGGADGNGPQNVACRSCEKGNSSYDARHVLTTNFSYQVPFGRKHWYGGLQWSGIASARTGLPLNLSVTRKATDVLDGNTLSTQRPDLVPGVPLYLDYGTAGLWLNAAAFTAPKPGTWGNLGRNVLRAPGLFQIDTAVSKKTRFNERLGLELGVEIFNLMNHPQRAAPAANISSTSNFGRITAPVNTSPTGAGTPRQVQFLARFSF